MPDFGGWPEWLTYVGVAALTLAAAVVFLKGRGWRFWGLVAIAGWVLALGDNSPVYPILTRIVPGLMWQRVPARLLFLSMIGVAMLAGAGLEALLELGESASPNRWLRRWAFAWTVLFACLGLAGGVLAGSWGAPGLRWSMFLAGCVGAIGGVGVLLSGRFRRRDWLPEVFWLCLVVLELACVDGTLAEARPVPSGQELANLAQIGSTAAPGNDRIFSPSYSVPQNVAAENGLQLADGVNPLQLKAYWDYMAKAVGFDPGQYSVTLPPFPDGDPSAERAWGIDAQRLGWLSVQTVVSSYPLTARGMAFEGQRGGRYFYFNEDVAPRAWVQPGSDLALAAEGSQASLEYWSPNQIAVSANGPGRLVLSEIAYPGWGVTVDGVHATLEPAGGPVAICGSRSWLSRSQDGLRPCAGNVGGSALIARIRAGSARLEKRVTAEERRWVWWFAAAVAVVTSLPYLAAVLAPHPGWAFSGFVFGVDDGNSYIAKLRAGAMGAWLFKTPYTTFPQAGSPVFLPYLLLGKLAGFHPSHTALAIIYQAFRLAVIPLCVMATYRFVALFVPSATWRRWVTALATVGGGLGWLVLAIWPSAMSSGLPLSFISPETFGFLAFYGLPHLVLARGLLLFGLTAYIEARAGLTSFWRAGLWLIGVALVQPIDLVPAGAVMGGMALTEMASVRGSSAMWGSVKREASRLGQVWLPALPVIVTLGLSLVFDPYMRIWGSQNRLESPPAAYYLVAFGAVIVPAVAGGWQSVRSRLSVSRLVPLVWVLLLPALVYAPITVQRRLAEGSWVAWLILAAMGLDGLQHRWQGSIRYGVLALSLPAGVILVAGGLRTAFNPARPAFLPADTASALAQLSLVAPEDSVLLASLPVANAAPAWAGVRVPVGHGPESAGHDLERQKVEAFYGGQMNLGAQEAYLASHGINFVFYGPDERKLGSWVPADLPGLRLVVSSADTSIYQVGSVIADVGKRR